MDAKEYITKKQLADKLNCSIRTLTEWQRQGMPVAIRRGRRFIRYDYEEVEAWVRDKSVVPRQLKAE